MKAFLYSLIVFIIFMTCACRTEYIPIETVRTDSIFLAKLQKDSIYIKDSVFVRQENDTVWKEKYKQIYKYVLQRDTVFISRIDSVQVPVQVEKKIGFWEQKKQEAGLIIIGMVITLAILLLRKWMIRIKNNFLSL